MNVGYRNSPKLLRGAFAIYAKDDKQTTPKVVVFQYNPETIRRTLTAKGLPEALRKGAREDGLRVVGPPDETISMTIELDAADQVAANNPTTLEHGLLPTLSMLEVLLYPARDWESRTTKDAQDGKPAVLTAKVPLTLLVWGKSRVVPVLLTSFSVTEEAFDPRLNPINAKVEVGMRVLTSLDLDGSSLGYSAYLAYAKAKENLADKAPLADASSEQSQLAGDATREQGGP